MREILFRGFYHFEKNALYSEVKKWVYGNFIKKEDDTLWINEIKVTGKGTAMRTNTTYKVIPESVGQYTTRKDVDEKKIFENHILEFTVFDHSDNDTQYRGIVKWNDEFCEFYIANINDDGYYNGDYYNFSWVHQQDCELKIIRNTTDNPELLKDGK